MRIKILIFAVLQLLALSSGASELTLEEFNSRINDGEFTQEDSDLIIEAFKNQDIEKVLACFKSNQEAYAGMIRPFNYCPKGDFKNELVTRILREPWLEDSPDGGLPSVSRGARYLMVEGICLSVIQDYLPNEVVGLSNGGGSDLFSHHAGRIALAERFQAALAAAAKKPNVTAADDGKVNGIGQMPYLDGTKESHITQPRTEDSTLESRAHTHSKFPWVVLISSLILTCLFYLFRKGKSRG